MKSLFKVFGIVALVAIIGFSFAACNADGNGGGGGGGGTSTYSLDGVWESSAGTRVTVSGRTGVISVLGSYSGANQDAINKGLFKIGSQYWRNLTSTANLTWSGQILIAQYYTSNPNVAIGTTWDNRTFTMSANGQTLTIKDSSGTGTSTWTRK